MLRCRYRISKPWGARRPILTVTIEYDPILDSVFDKILMIVQPAFISHFHTLLPNIGEYLTYDPVKHGDIYLEHKKPERKFVGEVILPIRPRSQTLATARELAWFVLHRVVVAVAVRVTGGWNEGKIYL